MTSDVSLNTIATQAGKTATSKTGLATDFNQFLTLLTTQLQNQDPLSPMDSTEFTNQLVQFSQVEQAINQNQKLDNLLALQLSNVSSMSLGYVGLDASYLSSEMNYDGSVPVDVSYSLAGEATNSKINILNEAGDVVYSVDAEKTAGAHKFTWNGETNGGEPAKAGTYTLQVAALDANNAMIDSTTVVTGRVRGVETQNGIINLLIGDRAVPISNVINASQPKTAQTAATTGAGTATGTENATNDTGSSGVAA